MTFPLFNINLVLMGSYREYDVCEPVLVLNLLEIDLIKQKSLTFNAVPINADHRKSEEAYETEIAINFEKRVLTGIISGPVSVD